MSAITDNLADIGSGLLITLVISVLSYAGGLILGSLMAILRVGPIPPLRALGAAWVTVACNIPNLCLMVLIGLALPHVGIKIPLFWSVVVELTAVTQKINQDRAAGVITFLTSGLTYLAIAFAATKLGGLLERRLEFMGKERA